MFRTEIKIPSSPYKINHSTPILTLGSCFAEVIGNKFSGHKFPTLSNPYGTIFNPISLFKLINLSTKNVSATPPFLHNEIWYSYDFHSEIYAKTKNEFEQKILNINQEVKDYLLRTKVIILTLGTAFVFREKATTNIVANCHKMPAANFTKEFLSAEEIILAFDEMYKEIHTLNPAIQVILTVSPVRHLKDTIRLNSVSKAVLQLASYTISEKYDQVNYFPAFEIMMDDLRDYRFYKDDMIHPSELAENYIWEKFQESYFSNETIEINERWIKIKKALEHKPFNSETNIYTSFVKDTIEKLKSLGKDINVDAEIKQMEEQLK